MEVKGDKKKMVIYKEMQYGSKPSKYERENRKWVEDNTPGKSTSRKMKIDSCRAAGTAAGTATDKVLIANGLGTKKEVEVNAKKAKCGTRVAEFSGLELLNAGAEAKVANASAGTSVTPVQAEASAKASGAEAGASAALVKDVIEVGARAVAGEAKARAGAGVKDLGARAEASAVVAKVEAGVTHVPFAQVSASGPGAQAEAGVSWKYAGASVAAFAGEARAGPFAARAGVKFGVGMRNGVPECDLGPVTVPCSVM